MKVYLVLFILAGVVVSLISAKALADAEGFPSFSESSDESSRDHALDLLRRITREAAKNADGKGVPCKYRKGQWSACDHQTKVRTRTFTLKKGDINTCESTKTLTKECKGGKKGGKQRNNAKNRSKNQNGETGPNAKRGSKE